MPGPNIRENKTDAGRIEKINPLKIEAVNGFRAKIKNIFTNAGVSVLIGGLTGSVAGSVIQHKYRDWTSYNPNEQKQGEIIDKDREQKNEEDEEAGNLLAKARQKLQKAREWSVDKINQTAIVSEYKDTVQELKDMYRKLLEAGDKISFWLPFLITFLTTIILANKIIKLKKSLTEKVDPAVERNMRLMEAKINELIERANQNSISIQEQMAIKEAMLELMRNFEDQESNISKLT